MGTQRLLLLCFALAGGLLGAVAAQAAAEDCRRTIPDGAAVRVSGLLGSSLSGRGADAPLVPLHDATLRAGGLTCRGDIRARAPEGVRALPAGASVMLQGRWRAARPDPTPWPAEPAYAGIVLTDRLLAARPPSPARHPLLFLRGRAQERIAALFPRQAPLVDALLLGRREEVDPAVAERFTRAGLVHLLAISGAHVGLFSSMLLLVGGAARLSPDRVRLATILATALYLGVIGAPASAVRAGIMLSLALLARIAQRPSAALPMIAAAALALLAADPLLVLDAGFQLSFSGVLALLLAGRLRVRPSLSGPAGVAARYLSDAMLVSVLAFACTAPVVAHHFHAVAPVSILANLPAVPLTGLALAGVVAAVAASAISFPLGRLLADGAGAALDGVAWIARLAADPAWGPIPVDRPDWGMWGAALVIAALALHAAGPVRPPVRWSVAVATALAVLLAWPATAARGPDAVELHFLDVGQGDAVAIRTPRGRWVLIDAGPRTMGYDAGERRVLPFLRSRRAGRLAALILTHPDADHIGGAPAVLRGIPVDLVMEPGLPVGKGLYLEMTEVIGERGVRWAAARAGRTLSVDGLELRFLWPTPEAVARSEEANDVSAVVLLRFGAFRALLPGDASAAVEAQVVAAGAAGPVQLLKAGHHGSATSTSAALLYALGPELVVISAGRGNRYGHPAPEVLRRLRSAGTEIARTDLAGTVSVKADRDGSWRRME